MKKLISMMIAVTMLLSLCVVSVNAETVEHPTINVYSELYDGTNPPSNYKPGTYDVYKVTYTTSGIDGNYDKMAIMNIVFSIDDSSKIASKTWSFPKTSGSASQKDANGVKSYLLDGEGAPVKPSNIMEGLYSWQYTGTGIDAFDWDTYEDGGIQESKPYIETLVYVTKGETVTFTYQTALTGAGDPQSEITLISWDDEDDPTAYRYYNDELRYTVNGAPGNVLTLGEEEEEGIDPVEEVAAAAQGAALTDLDGNAVALDADYGIAKFDTAINTGLYNYFIVAKTATATSDPMAVDFSGALEVGGKVSFYAVVKSTHGAITSLKLQEVEK